MEASNTNRLHAEIHDNSEVSTNNTENSTLNITIPLNTVELIMSKMDPSFRVVKYCAISKTRAGDNYMSEIYFVDVDGVSKAEPLEKLKRSFLYKALPMEEDTRKMLNECLAFVKEALVYEEMIPELEKASGLEMDVPKYFASFHDGISDYIVLEDLSHQGYKMADRRIGLNLEECIMALKYLAKFHALSYSTFKGDFDKIVKKCPELHNHERIYVPSEQVSPMKLAYVRQTGQSYFEAFVENGNSIDAARIRDLLIIDPENVVAMLHKKITSRIKHAVIGHGDYWTNNLLFKYGNRNLERSPTGMKMIDFQMARIGSRTVDLHLFLQTSPESALQNNNAWYELLKIYHEEFTSILNSLGIYKDELHFDQLKKEFDDYRYVGICMGLSYIQFVNAKPEDFGQSEAFQGTADEKNYQLFRPLINSDTLTKISRMLNQYDSYLLEQKQGPMEVPNKCEANCNFEFEKVLSVKNV